MRVKLDRKLLLDILRRRLSPSRHMSSIHKVYIHDSTKTRVVIALKPKSAKEISDISSALQVMFADVNDIVLAVYKRGSRASYGLDGDVSVAYEWGEWSAEL